MHRIILCRIAWMKFYQGTANIDIPRSGSKYILKHKTGGEIYNFKNRNGKVYGYFPDILNCTIQNLGAKKSDELLLNVTVVFCAKHPVEGGIRVVGWYKKATLLRTYHQNSAGIEYHAVSSAKNVVLIPEDDRIFRLSETFGRSSLYYINSHPEKKKLQLKLENYIALNGIIKLPRPRNENGKAGRAYQPDLEKKLLVEHKAIFIAKRHYGERYDAKNIITVESENKGWDIEVKTPTKKLIIEVKGLSGLELFIEMTPNEFKAFDSHNTNYQLFVVNDTLSRKPLIRIYKYQAKGNIWVGNDKSVLKVNIVRGARLCLR